MARTASPWFWEERNAWYVVVGGERQFLGDHPPDGSSPRKRNGKWVIPKAIQTVFHDLMSGKPSPPVIGARSGTLAGEIFEKYLEWCQEHRSPRTYEWYQNHIQSFIDSLSDKRLAVAAIRPFHVQQWADSKPTWGPNHRRGGITAIQRAFSWAEKMGHILKSPIRHIEKPAAKRREQLLTAEEFRVLLINVKDESFRAVLEFCWETGCRVQEVRVIEAQHVQLDRARIELPPAQAKGKKRWRIIYLTARASELVRGLIANHVEGPIFQNRDGRPWTAQAFNCRFCRLQKKLGIKYALTALRHSFATRLLESGSDHITVAALLGHADATMLAKVYQHVGDRNDYLLHELRKVSDGGSAA